MSKEILVSVNVKLDKLYNCLYTSAIHCGKEYAFLKEVRGKPKHLNLDS